MHTSSNKAKRDTNSKPLDEQLEEILNSTRELVRTSEMVSINASISASQIHSEEGKVFKIIAKEIREISQRSLKKLSELNQIFNQINLLSQTINIAGRQRMLAQKYLKLLLLEQLQEGENWVNNHEIEECQALFESSLRFLKQNSLNNELIEKGLQEVKEDWNAFLATTKSKNYGKAHLDNNKVVESMNRVVNLYEALAGGDE